MRLLYAMLLLAVGLVTAAGCARDGVCASASAWFTIRAYGDLDCDGVYSTYEVTGRVAQHGGTEVAEPRAVREDE